MLKKLAKDVLKFMGYTVHKINYEQMMEGLLLPIEKMPQCKLLPSRESVLPLLPKRGIIAEVGVEYGDFSKKIIDILTPSAFYAIDGYWIKPGREPLGKTTLMDAGMTQKEYVENRFKTEIEQGTFIVKQGYSWDVLETFPDDFFDYIYLDASHDYKSVKKDISILINKIKNNGIIQFNDYTFIDWKVGCYYGVVRAVDEFLMQGKHEMLYFCLQTAGFNDVVVKIRK
jgi:hypothetical protein